MNCSKHGECSVFCAQCDIDTIKVHEKAVELFTVFSSTMNSVKNHYCNNFDDLEQRLKLSWLKVAEHSLAQENK